MLTESQQTVLVSAGITLASVIVGAALRSDKDLGDTLGKIVECGTRVLDQSGKLLGESV